MLTHRLHSRADHSVLLTGLAAWDAHGGAVPGLHAGDVGWALREDDDAWALHGWWEGQSLVAAALCEGQVARPRVSPQRGDDRELAAAVAELVEALPGEQLWSDARPGTMLRTEFTNRGWVDDAEDPWVCLHVDLRTRAPEADLALEAHACVGDRVTVQRAGFDGSTFTEEKWLRMAAGAGYRSALDLVVRDANGVAAAAGTAWLSVDGGSAILEPVSTHRDHRRAGHGTRVVRALAAASRRHGAAGLNVWTPRSNEAAVRVYQAAGLAVVDEATAVWLDRRPSS